MITQTNEQVQSMALATVIRTRLMVGAVVDAVIGGMTMGGAVYLATRNGGVLTILALGGVSATLMLISTAARGQDSAGVTLMAVSATAPENTSK